MPGIVGLVTKVPGEQAEREVRRMVASLLHEPFYVSATWFDESLGVYLGWVARRGSFCDGMPLPNERGDVVLVFAGEEYPEPGVKCRLEARGHTLDRDGPSYLVHEYEEDSEFPAGLNGIFHGLVVDRRRGSATLFNDRYGMHRVCYHESKDGFYFAAEAKAILAVRPELRETDPRGLGEFIACGCVLENRTVFPRIKVLPGGSAWTFCRGTLERRATYFQPGEWEAQPPLDPESYFQELGRVFSANLPRYFNGRERVALALTGGLDTRLIMASREAPMGSLPCYTFGSAFRDSQDVRVARDVAKASKQSHSVITVGAEFLSRFPHYVQRSIHLTDGCVDSSRSPDLYVSEKARDIAPVKVVGTYGSEVVAPTPTFEPVSLLPGLFVPEVVSEVQRANATYGELRREHPVTFAAFRQSPWWHHGVLALEQTQLTVRSPYLDNDFIRTVYRAPRPAGDRSDVRLRLIRKGNPALGRIRTDRGVGGSAAALFAAVTRGLLEFTFKAEHAYDYAMPQWLAQIDHLLSPFHPERILLGRHKVSHFRVWFRDTLSPYLRDVLLDPGTLSRPYLHGKAVEAVVRAHLAGRRNYTREIHKLLTLEILHRALSRDVISGFDNE